MNRTQWLRRGMPQNEVDRQEMNDSGAPNGFRFYSKCNEKSLKGTRREYHDPIRVLTQLNCWKANWKSRSGTRETRMELMAIIRVGTVEMERSGHSQVVRPTGPSHGLEFWVTGKGGTEANYLSLAWTTGWMFVNGHDWARTDLGGESEGFHLGYVKFEITQRHRWRWQISNKIPKP